MRQTVSTMYLIAQTLATVGTQRFAPMVCRGLRRISFTMWWTAVASTDGDFFFEGSDDPRVASDPANATWVILTPPSASLHKNGSDVTLSGNLFTINASAEEMIVNFADPPAYVRLCYTRRGGGGAAQLNVAQSGTE